MTEFFNAHHELILFARTTFGLAEVSTMPPPGTKWAWGTFYDWQYAAIHLFVSIADRKRVEPVTVAKEEGK
jgi:hypothetical protein